MSVIIRCALAIIFIYGITLSCTEKPAPVSADEEALRTLHEKYVQGWLNNDRALILSLFTPDARLQPSGLTPVKGLEQIRQFWFPDDHSVTTVNAFSTELLWLQVMDTMAVSTQRTRLDWSYHKDTLDSHAIQSGIATSIFKKRNQEWLIWRQMWSDYEMLPQ